MSTFNPLIDGEPDHTMPDAWAVTLDDIAPGVADAASQQQAAGESWIDSLARTLPLLVTSDAQRRLLNVQIDRARQGLPPLDVSQYSAGVNVGLSGDTLRTVGLVGIGLVGLLALALLNRRR